MKGQLATSCNWVNNTIPALYNQNVSDKIDVTTLQQMTPHCLNKLILTSASITYANRLKQCSSIITTASAKPSQFNWPPCHCITKPADVMFTDTNTKPSTLQSSQTALSTTPTTQMTPTTTNPLTFDYQAKLKRITLEIEKTLSQNLMQQLISSSKPSTTLTKNLIKS